MAGAAGSVVGSEAGTGRAGRRGDGVGMSVGEAVRVRRWHGAVASLEWTHDQLVPAGPWLPWGWAKGGHSWLWGSS